MGISVKAFESADEPNAFEVTGSNNGVEEKLVLACPDEAEGQKWIAGLNKFAHTEKIKAAKAEVKEYKEKLAAYKKEVDVDKQKEQLDSSFKQLFTFVMMKGCDQTKYGSLMKGLVSQYSMKN